VPTARLGRSAAPGAWTALVLSNACSSAALGGIGIAASVPSFDRVARGDVVGSAWGEVRADRGAAGLDRLTIDGIESSGVGEFLEALAAGLGAGGYRPRPLRRVRIPRPGGRGQTRPLAIPTVAERVVMAAARIVLEPSLEADFPPTRYRFRPRLSAHRAPETVRRTVTRGGRRWALDADIEGCFDEIDHDALGARIERRVWDRRLLKLPRGRLRARVAMREPRATTTLPGLAVGDPGPVARSPRLDDLRTPRVRHPATRSVRARRSGCSRRAPRPSFVISFARWVLHLTAG
jgi:hypothetical protein